MTLYVIVTVVVFIAIGVYAVVLFNQDRLK